jgi:hypothetical protein
MALYSSVLGHVGDVTVIGLVLLGTQANYVAGSPVPGIPSVLHELANFAPQKKGSL